MKLINLTCPNCGAAIEVTEDLDRFACSYCGKEVLVKRAGGAVSLKPVLEQVRDGAVRTASELAIQRLDGEIEELLEQRDPVAKKADLSGIVTMLVVFGCVPMAAGVWMLVQDTDLACCAWPMVIVGIIVVGYCLMSWGNAGDARTELERLDALIEKKQDELRSHKEIVEVGAKENVETIR